MKYVLSRWFSLCVALLVPTSVSVAAEKMQVDVVLVLAVDASESVSSKRWDLQIQGYAEAFRNPSVISALTSGVYGKVAVAMVQWASMRQQEIVVPWCVITGPESSYGIAAQLEKVPRVFQGNTSISAALAFSGIYIESAPFIAGRKIIDISGDGRNNEGELVDVMRTLVVQQGITINGLPIQGVELEIDRYYEENVIGGESAFSMPVADIAEFGAVLRQKIIREVAQK